ncbi:hypothetical protein DERP_012335 [Dermatophagoides pteronyssinus]|uniref:Uncharacterized protein n=1 Tax=Dermatophagoides pteronyssinus TaxID=6956 RepID=A0ABQ8JR16_DERPT|nr:hypothetical protein DERP_012335 [Dermatophagoides pteronyssinus]
MITIKLDSVMATYKLDYYFFDSDDDDDRRRKRTSNNVDHDDQRQKYRNLNSKVPETYRTQLAFLAHGIRNSLDKLPTHIVWNNFSACKSSNSSVAISIPFG